ncbi:unnamed protein product [Rotaria magnacalcarata]
MLAEELNNLESRRLLSIVDQMREILHREKISLPHIVVVGDQSAGKSSVLEALSGIQLPRGQNICTRCPLELRMKNTSGDEFAEIHCDGVDDMRLSDFGTISSHVFECTNKLAGTNMGVSSSPIYLTVYKNDIQEDLTLIDLPGITRNAVGDQPENIYERIVDLIIKYIKEPTAIVLHVIPSSEDFTNSESMKICKIHDPNSDRQLIAVSKIDKYDKGIGHKLQGMGPGSMALKLGCVAVLNRTPEQIEDNVSFSRMRQLEQQFFQRTEAFQHVPTQYLGCEQLIKRLVAIQQTRIRSTLPGILNELKCQIKQKKCELKNMPEAITSEIECWTLYEGLVKKYRDLVYARVHGVHDYDMQLTMEVSAGDSCNLNPDQIANQMTADGFDDRIAFQLHKKHKEFAKEISHSFSQFFKKAYRDYVLKLLEENAGVALPNFPSFSIIERLYHYEHRNFREPCECLIENYVTYLKGVLLKLLNQIFDKKATYKDYLIHKLTDIIIRALDESEEHCNDDITKMLSIEKRVFTLNHYYMDTVNKIKANVHEHIESNKSEGLFGVIRPKEIKNVAANDFEIDFSDVSNEHQAALDVQIAIKAYCHVVEKRVVDQATQLCYFWFVDKCVMKLDSKFSSTFTSATLFEWMREPFEQQQKRENLRKSIQSMEKALSTGLNT